MQTPNWKKNKIGETVVIPNNVMMAKGDNYLLSVPDFTNDEGKIVGAIYIDGTMKDTVETKGVHSVHDCMELAEKRLKELLIERES